MKEIIEKVEQFQKAFGQNVEKTPTLTNLEIAKLRYELMKEENEEYLEAANNNDIVGICDGITDQLFIIIGTAITHGVQHLLEPLFYEVHYSNMSKLDDNGNPIINGENGVLDETRPLGKVLKSKNYYHPDIHSQLEKFYSKVATNPITINVSHLIPSENFIELLIDYVNRLSSVGLEERQVTIEVKEGKDLDYLRKQFRDYYWSNKYGEVVLFAPGVEEFPLPDQETMFATWSKDFFMGIGVVTLKIINNK